jgi:hypothetical protein
VADGGLGTVRDDELVAEQVEAREGLLNGDLHALARERLAVEEKGTILFLGGAKEPACRIHAGLRAALRAPDAVELGLVLDAAPLHERLAIGGDLDPFGPKLVREQERERGRDDRAFNAELLDGTDRGAETDLLHRNPLPDQLVITELLVRVRLQAVVAFYALDFERRDHDVALAIMFEIEERVRNRHGNLVAHLRGADCVGPDQDVRHGAGCYPLLDTRT